MIFIENYYEFSLKLNYFLNEKKNCPIDILRIYCRVSKYSSIPHRVSLVLHVNKFNFSRCIYIYYFQSRYLAMRQYTDTECTTMLLRTPGVYRITY